MKRKTSGRTLRFGTRSIRGHQPASGHGAAGMEHRRAMEHLRRQLTSAEFSRVCTLTQDGRRLPFGADSEAAMERLLLQAGDEDLELLIKCQSALESLPPEHALSGHSGPSGTSYAGEGNGIPTRDGHLARIDSDGIDDGWEAPRPSPRDRLHFHFDMDSQVLNPFLASLRRNGFRAVTVESAAEVDVFVALGGITDLEVVREMELVQSLLEIVHGTVTRSVRGRRLTP